MGSGGVLVLGESKAASRRKRGVSFPRALASSGSWPGGSTQPLPALWDQPVATHRHTQALVPRPKESSTHGQLPWQPRGSFHSPPSRPPLLPALQPTGLCASLERTIKLAPVALGKGGDLRPWREASGANPRRRKSRFVKAGGRRLSVQSGSVMSPSLPAQCLCLAFLLLRLLGQVSGAPLGCPWLLCLPGRRVLGPQVAPPSIDPAERFLLPVSPAPRSLPLSAAPTHARPGAPRRRRRAPPG